MLKKRTAKKLVLPLLMLLFIVAGCSQGEDRALVQEPYEQTEFLMGTVTNIKIYNEGKEDALSQAFDRVVELDAKIDVNKPDSEISQINQHAGVQPVEVSEDVFDLVERAYYYSDVPNSGFDMTIGPITELWHIGYDDAQVPSQEEIDEALALVDYSLVEMDAENQTVYLPNTGMRLDLGAIAKGFITDEVVEVLEENDVDTAIIDMGGNIFVMGNSTRGPNEPWNVGIQNPFGERGSIIGAMPVSDQSIVTSGIYERNLEVDGEMFHHLMNPETGYPFENELAGVSVVTEVSMDGDGLSTTVFSMGLEEGLDYVNSLENTEGIFITKDKEVYVSAGYEENIELTNDEFTLKD